MWRIQAAKGARCSDEFKRAKDRLETRVAMSRRPAFRSVHSASPACEFRAQIAIQCGSSCLITGGRQAILNAARVIPIRYKHGHERGGRRNIQLDERNRDTSPLAMLMGCLPVPPCSTCNAAFAIERKRFTRKISACRALSDPKALHRSPSLNLTDAQIGMMRSTRRMDMTWNFSTLHVRWSRWTMR